MHKKNIIITGASDGIGAAAARQLANTVGQYSWPIMKIINFI
ncbi:hypothetical protein [Weissella hellenica]